jgi:hypothetical protein
MSDNDTPVVFLKGEIPLFTRTELRKAVQAVGASRWSTTSSLLSVQVNQELLDTPGGLSGVDQMIEGARKAFGDRLMITTSYGGSIELNIWENDNALRKILLEKHSTEDASKALDRDAL